MPIDPERYYDRLTVQVINAAGDPRPDGYGAERVISETPHIPGQPTTVNAVSGWPIPDASDPYRIHRFRLYCINIVGIATLQTTAWSGGTADHFDVDPTTIAEGGHDSRYTKPSSLGSGLTKDPNTGQVRRASDNTANLLDDPGFEFGGGKWTQSGTISFVTSPVQTGTRSAKLQGAYTTLIQNISCRPGETYYTEEYLAADTGTNGLGRIYLQPLDAALAWVGTGVYADAGSPPAAGTWVKISKSITIPAGASYLSIWVWVLGNSTGAWYCDNVYASKVTTGDEIALGGGLTKTPDGYVAINPGSSIDIDGTGKAVVKLGSLTNVFLAPGALGDLSKYTADKQPFGIYSGLPSASDPTVPDLIFVTAPPGRVYRKYAGSWDAGVQPGDIIAGTVASGVTITGTCYANKLVENGGGITGCRLQLNLNGVTASIANTYDASYGGYAGVLVQANGSNARALMSYAGVAVINSGGYRTAELSSGYFTLGNASGNVTIQAVGADGLIYCKELVADGAESLVCQGKVAFYGQLYYGGALVWRDANGFLRN